MRLFLSLVSVIAVFSQTCDPNNRYDCGYYGITQSECEQRECCWQATSGQAYCFFPADANPFTPDENAQILGYFVNNIDSLDNGAVMASPSTTHPDYYYHWMRDAAISMNILNQYNGAGKYTKQLQDYVNWVRAAQFASDPNGIDVRGEPKFEMDGKVYSGGWLRPQNDGAGLRAIALTNYANVLISQGQKDYVTKYLYSSDPSQPGIKRDLDYVASVWQQPTGDPWEEVTGQHFFTWMAQRKGLLVGAQLAAALGDSASATNYNNVAKTMETYIDSHWNASTGVIMETPPGHGGPQKYHELDSAVHLGVLYGSNGDGFYDADTSKVQSSVAQLVDWFSQPSVFPINNADSADGLPGILVGRYPNDTYDGYNTGSVGNPWILCTLGLGEIYYRNGMLLSQKKQVVIDEYNQLFFKQAARFVKNAHLESQIRPGMIFSLHNVSTAHSFAKLMSALVSQGDAELMRIKYHTAGADFHFSEQLNLQTGVEQGANDLTWSYGTLLAANLVRPQAVEAVRSVIRNLPPSPVNV